MPRAKTGCCIPLLLRGQWNLGTGRQQQQRKERKTNEPAAWHFYIHQGIPSAASITFDAALKPEQRFARPILLDVLGFGIGDELFDFLVPWIGRARVFRIKKVLKKISGANQDKRNETDKIPMTLST